MHIFLITGVIPFRKDGMPGVTAAHVISSAFVRTLQQAGHTVTLQLLFHQSRAPGPYTPEEEAEVQYIEQSGCTVLPPCFLADVVRDIPIPFRSLRYVFDFQAALRHFYPGSWASEILRERVNRTRPDVILTIWSPQGVAATHGITHIPRVAYHGDIDFQPRACRLVKDPELFGEASVSLWHRMDQRLRLALFRKAHMQLMNALTGIANVTAAVSDVYTAAGHSLSVYVRNTWPDTPLADTPTKKGPIRILGHMGRLDATGGTYGLRYLLRDVLPRLSTLLKGHLYEVHVIGTGEALPAIRPLLSQEHVVVRGFVEDLSEELSSTHVFCLLNNAGPYIAGYTRHLVAWANGLCLVAHDRSQRAIPEIQNGVNALTAGDPEGIAMAIARAATDIEYNKRIRAGGRATYESFFRSELVAQNLEDVLVRSVQRHRQS